MAPGPRRRMTDARPRKLPRGRHHLTREQVEGSQRERMLLGLAMAVTEKGYVGTAVADVLTRAGVSRETFYQQFSSKLDCFMSAFDVAGDVLVGRLREATRDGDGTPLERFDRAVGAYLEVLAEQPALARVFLVEAYAAGPEAMRRRAALQARVVERMADLLDIRTDQGRFACQVVVAGMSMLVTGPIVDNDLEALSDLRPRLVELVANSGLVGH
jgi:AcrR family transcriptional regulator